MFYNIIKKIKGDMSWTPSDFVGLGLGKAYKKKALQNPMVKDEYDALQPEYDEKQLTISTRDHFNN